MLIGITGKAGSGKDTISDALVESLSYRKIAFADTLKNMMCIMLNVSREELEDRDFKESFPELLNGKSVRYAMQTLGTEWGRDNFGENVWVNITGNKILDLRSPSKSKNYDDGIVVSDVRFDSEANAIKALGGFIIEVSRENLSEVENHVSEKGIDESLIDVKFENNFKTVEDVKKSFIDLMDILENASQHQQNQELSMN